MHHNHSANRCVMIDCDVGDALAFVREVANLPAWTFFFRNAINRQDDRIRFDTPLGECLTRIRTKQGTDWAAARIHSRFESGEDSALLHFTRNNTGQTLASFYATFPPALPEKRRAGVLDQIERELFRLKAILERMHAAKTTGMIV